MTCVRIFFIVLLCAYAVYTDAGQVETDASTVWLPSTMSPYRKIFNDVLDGIRSEVSGINTVVVDEPTEWLPSVAKGIVLSKPLIDTLNVANRGNKTIGMIYQSNGVSGVSGVTLDITPLVWLNSIRNVAPRVQHIVFVGWDEIHSHDSVETSSIPTNILGRYEKMPALRVKEGRVAVVFSNSVLNRMPEKYMARLLDVAWAEEWVTVTGNYNYGSMGFTLSVVPNYYKYGQQIGKHYNSIENGERLPTEQVTAVDVSVSIKSARRVGIDTRRHSLKLFNGIFP